MGILGRSYMLITSSSLMVKLEFLLVFVLSFKASFK